MKSLSIRLMGVPEVRLSEKLLSFRTRKVLALLIYLVIERRMHSRESLMALLWPESPPKNAATALRVTLSRLRKAVQPGSDLLVSEAGKLGIDPTCIIDLDLDWLAVAANQETSPDKLSPILAMDRGEFLEGFTLPDAPTFDTWAAIWREACQRQLETVYDRLSQYLLAIHDSATAVETAARWVARAPLSEQAYRRLMAAQALYGQRPAALLTYHQLQDTLIKELSLQPSRETVLLANNIDQGRINVGRLDSSRKIGRVSSTDQKRHLTLPLVGRSAEHSRLVDSFHQIGGEKAQAVVLIGATGVGKTRLLNAFRDWALLDSPETEVWQGLAFEMGGRLAFQPVVEALRIRLDQVNAPEDLLEDVWLAELSQLMPELRARYPDLPMPLTGDANFMRARLFEAIAILGNVLAGHHPSILILDDMQWADADTLDLIRYVARRWTEMNAPILLLLTVRQEAYAADATLREWLTRLERDTSLTRLLLDNLSAAAVEGLVKTLAGDEADETSTSAFGAWLWAETRGLPFFIEALLQMLIEQGILVPIEGGRPTYNFAAALEHVRSVSRVPLPPGVREVVRARLEQHSKEAKGLLLAAAVLGRASTFERLCQIADLQETDALESLEALLDGRLLTEQPSDRRPYMLAHDYIREVVYTESNEARRRVYHRRALLALEAASSPAAECAYHALASALDEPAFRFSLAAGDEALAAWAFEDSLAHYDQAREIAQRMEMTAAIIAPQSVRRLYQNRGRALELTEDYPAALENYEEMREVAASRLDQAMRLAGLSAQCIIQATHTPVYNPIKARELGLAALELSRALEDRAAEARALWGMMLVELYGGGDSRTTLAYGQQSLSLARELGLKEQMGYVLVNLCWPYMAQKQFEAALEANSEARDIWHELGNLPMLLETYDMRQYILFIAGDLRGALAAAGEALRLSRLTGNQVYQGNSLRLMGDIHRLQGRFGEALAKIKASMVLSEASGNPISKQGDYYSLVMLYLNAGALDQVDLWADRLYTSLQESSTVAFLILFLSGVAQAKVALGELDEGQAILDQAFEAGNWDALWSNTLISASIADGHLQLALGRPERVFDRQERVQRLRQAGLLQFLSETLWLQGKAWMAVDNLEQAKEVLLESKAVAEEKDERAILWKTLATLSDLERKFGQESEADKLQRQAQEIINDITDHAGSDELRASFMAQPEVLRVFSER